MYIQCLIVGFFILFTADLITRNNTFDLSQDNVHRHKICDALAVSSIISNCAGVESTTDRCLGLQEFREFLRDYQDEQLPDHEILELIQRHEPDSVLRDQCCLSFEGFARFLMDKDNYACIPEKMPCKEEVCHRPTFCHMTSFIIGLKVV